MRSVGYILFNIIHTLLRVFPFPGRTGLVKIGNPDRRSPVLLTGNYVLTVRRLKRSLKGQNVYLLIANSRGINVWCAAAGGLLNNHSAISVIKTSGIEDLVDHRQVVLPQLAATGLDQRVIHHKTGWRTVWGPVYASDLPAFLDSRFRKTKNMSTVKFEFPDQVEMATAWAFPISLVAALIALPFWPQVVLPLSAIIWGLSFIIFLTFPLYKKYLSTSDKHKGFIFFDFGRGGLQLIFWAGFMAVYLIFTLATDQLTLAGFLRWLFLSVAVILVLSLDLMGSTPLFKSGLHEDRLFKIKLDVQKCRGAGFCEQVCPKDCFDVDKTHHTASIPRAADCVQCGACIVQCPFDALFFHNHNGEIIPPQEIRTYKLNLMGQRSIKAKAAE